MRKVIYGAAVTIDGYIARPDDRVDYLVMTRDTANLMQGFFHGIDTIVMGRKTWEVSQRMHGGKAPTGPWKTYIFSTTLPPGEREGVTFVNESPAAFVRKLRKRPGKSIFLMGGGELARSFLQDDLVDELSIGIVPILLGAGIPLTPPGFPQRDFRLVENKTYAKNSVALKYERVRPKKSLRRKRS